MGPGLSKYMFNLMMPRNDQSYGEEKATGKERKPERERWAREKEMKRERGRKGNGDCLREAGNGPAIEIPRRCIDMFKKIHGAS